MDEILLAIEAMEDLRNTDPEFPHDELDTVLRYLKKKSRSLMQKNTDENNPETSNPTDEQA